MNEGKGKQDASASAASTKEYERGFYPRSSTFHDPDPVPTAHNLHLPDPVTFTSYVYQQCIGSSSLHSLIRKSLGCPGLERAARRIFLAPFDMPNLPKLVTVNLVRLSQCVRLSIRCSMRRRLRGEAAGIDGAGTEVGGGRDIQVGHRYRHYPDYNQRHRHYYDRQIS
ncbi:hypothetical protein BDP27DRAFT_1371894 [Rhodocollybia butyracea]|uniref:Uncharacterized protein n=1 Tax=Rhodocollybia butyracea TaxID=206335 RepID=A0A9P5TX42_9AGAR|nr:hypothetical protein BDP27DRAFT_1371894 [Rhodocollybia butyracea]